jgi:hypothetical protein
VSREIVVVLVTEEGEEVVVVVVVVAAAAVVVVVIIIIIHIPYFTAVQLVPKRVQVSLTKNFLLTVLPKTFGLYGIN